MSQLLSQKEIDLLLKGIPSLVSTEEAPPESDLTEGDIIPFDLAHQNRVIRGRMPALEMIHNRFARLFRQTVSNHMRRPITVQNRATELMSYKDYMEGIAYPASINLFHMSPLRGIALLVFEQRLVYSFIDLLFGGTGGSEKSMVQRDFSNIELRMITKVVHSALEDLKSAWKPLVPLKLRYARSETNPRLVAIVPDTEVMVVTTFDVEIQHLTMTMSIGVPYILLDPIRSKLSTSFQSEHTRNNKTVSNYLSQHVLQTFVNLKVSLGHTKISLRNFLNLEVGDHLVLEQEVHKPLQVMVQNVPKLEGFQGAYKGQRAIKISKLLYEPRSYSNLFEADPEEKED